MGQETNGVDDLAVEITGKTVQVRPLYETQPTYNLRLWQRWHCTLQGEVLVRQTVSNLWSYTHQTKACRVDGHDRRLARLRV